jgi:5'-phosphate synthase pdxT subunit
MTVVGVLALQGDVREHVASLDRLGVTTREVRLPRDLSAVDGLILPGGESTAIARLLDTSGLRPVVQQRLNEGMAAFGTCAGLIALASTILDGRSDQWSFGSLAVTVRRNGYGRQVASFETPVEVHGIGSVPGVFIRAPRIVEIGAGVEILATHDHGDGAHPVLVRQGAVLGCSFHPELTASTAIHEYFVRTVIAESL